MLFLSGMVMIKGSTLLQFSPVLPSHCQRG